MKNRTVLNYEGFETVLVALRYLPNFFCSREYFEAAGLQPVSYNDGSHVVYTVEDSKGNTFIEPFGNIQVPVNSFCDLGRAYNPRLQLVNKLPGVRSLMDVEFIYEPSMSLGLEGSEKRILRKNLRYFASKRAFTYVQGDMDSVFATFSEWLTFNAHQAFYDLDTLILYLQNKFKLSPKSDSVGCLFSGDRCLGFNAWDENSMFINFRYSFTTSEERGLSETLRYLFLQNCSRGKYINDGGSLGSDSLHAFKLRFQPVVINQRYTTTYPGGVRNVGEFEF